MADEKPVTIANLVTALKQAGFATKSDLAGFPTKKDVEDIVHNQLTEFHAGMIQPKLDRLNGQLERVERKVDRLSSEVSHLGNEIDGLKAEFSTTPSRSEFQQLKTRVRR